MNEWKNKLYYGDNLAVMREYLPKESVDLIYLDPPFNSNRNYNVLFKESGGQDSQAQIVAFKDTWQWDRTSERAYADLILCAPAQVAKMIGAIRDFIGINPMMAYLMMMTARLLELRRVLKPTGSLYLHCDPTASHYLRIVLDTIFGVENFRNEIIWKRTSAHSSANRYGAIHDVILFYTKTDRFCWNRQYTPYDPEYLKKFYRHTDEDGRRYRVSDLTAAGISNGSSGEVWRGIDVAGKRVHWKFGIDTLEKLDKQGRIYWPPKGTMPAYKRYLDEVKGIALQDIFSDIPPIGAQAKERMGYPTQKPVALLERMISASSNPGDMVLDPFCGCGTAVAAAQKLNRRWIGVDITHLAVALQKYRLKEGFGLIEKKDYEVIGEPKDAASAGQLAKDDRYQFQWWALSLVQAKPVSGEIESKKGKKGRDRGVDGVITFIDDDMHKAKRIIVQVKSGKVRPSDIRDLNGVIGREKAAMGIFITLEEPSRDMSAEAASAGYYFSPGWQKEYPKVQIFTIEDLISGKTADMPPIHATFKKSGRESLNNGTQNGFW